MITLYADTRPGGLAGLASMWAGWRARRLVQAGAVVVDTETTDFGGEIVEIAIADARTGTVLLDSLVRPAGAMHPDAARVSGITDDMCAQAPDWPTLWPSVRELLTGRPVCAWNAPFDRGRLAADCARHGLPMPRLRWVCLMRLDARHRGDRWRKLAGGHRAATDTAAATAVLHRIGDRS